jgi:hypothetical protein
MPSLFVYPYRGLRRRAQVSFLSFSETPDCLVVSPGGCGSNSLITYLDKYTKSNIYFEKKFKFFGLNHIYKPNFFLRKNKVKIILIKRDFKGIYNSMLSRGFVRNTLNFFGDYFPFVYINIFKNKRKLKKKYFYYLSFFYNNWKNYNQKHIIVLNYKDIYKSRKIQKKIQKFLNIKDKNFIKKFPKFKRYNKKKFIDPSTILSKKIYRLKG